MSNAYFQFQQFVVWHDQCAMKVGTDGVLLGAWAPIEQAQTVLDVGTGSGLIALMCAQRNPLAKIMALDIDADAIAQTQKNVQLSKWQDRIEVSQADFSQFHSDRKFDVIVSNPPYFQDSLKCPDAGRTTARHTDTLPFEQLIEKAYKLLNDRGVLAVVLPMIAEKQFQQLALQEGFAMQHITKVCTKVGKTPKRVLLALQKGKEDSEVIQDTLCIMNEENGYSNEYKQLTGTFYL